MMVRFKVRKRWFREEYWVYDVESGRFLTCFSSREEAEKLVDSLNGYYVAVNNINIE